MRRERISSLEVKPFRAFLKRPFVTSLGSKSWTDNVGLELRLSGGAQGYGEASSSLALALSPGKLSKALRGLGRWALGREASCPGDLIAKAWERWGHISPAAAAFECALLEAVAGSRGLSLAQYFGGKLKAVRSDLTISAWEARTAQEAALEAFQEGFRELKVKVRGEPQDLERLRAARRACPGSRILLDGNQGLTEAKTMRLIESCLKESIPVLLFEQPLPSADFKGMARLCRRSPVPIAADETARTPEEALRVIFEGAAKVINVKLAKSGLLGSLRIAAAARAAGLDLMIGCMAETAGGLSPSVHLALGTGFFRYVDLDSDILLKDREAPGTWVRRGPVLSLE